MRLTVSYRTLLGWTTVAAAAFGLVALPRAIAAVGAARTRLADVQRVVLRPPAAAMPILAGPVMAAPDDAAAAAMLHNMLRQHAVGAGVLAEAMEPLPDGPGGIVRARVALSGDGRALLRFAGRLEGSATPLRFSTWRLAHVPGSGAMRLSGEVAAPWRVR